MSRLMRRLTEQYIPIAAIVAYRSDAGGGYYLESRKIEKGKMCAGKPLTVNSLTSIVKKVQASTNSMDVSIGGVVPENLLYCSCDIGRTRLVWYEKPHQQMLYFKEDLEIGNGVMWVPGLVFSVEGENLYVYAYKGTGKPKGKLYLAPFMNVYNDGRICLGNASVKKPARNFTAMMAYWEEMFWKSEFSHLIVNTVSGNLASLTKELIKSGERFPTSSLVQTNVVKNIKDLLK